MNFHPFFAQSAEPDFPKGTKRHNDRLHKHVRIEDVTADTKFRVTAVDYKGNQKHLDVEKKKEISVHVPKDKQIKNLFRIKAVLKESDHGVKESGWVTQRNINISGTHLQNEYRIRGHAHNGLRSDWVYSGVKSIDNEYILSHMLYDLLDIALSVKDKGEIDYILDHALFGVYQEAIKDLSPRLIDLIDAEESYSLEFQELLSILASEANNPEEEALVELGETLQALSSLMKADFREYVMASPEEFTEFSTNHLILDQFAERQNDFLYLVLESYLDDRLGDLVQKADMEILTEKPGETGVFIRGSYELDLRDSLVRHIPEADLSESFVSVIDDAVRLLLDPVFSEELTYETAESIEKLFRLLTKDVYASFLAIDEYFLELEKELKDHHKHQMQEHLIEYSLINEKEQMRYMLLYDVLETAVKGDLEIKTDWHAQLIDRFLSSGLTSKIMLKLDYAFDETMTVILQAGESFQTNYKKLFYQEDETKEIYWEESAAALDLLHKDHAKDMYVMTFQSLASILSLDKLLHPQDHQVTQIVDALAKEELKEHETAQDDVFASFNSRMDHRNVFHQKNQKEIISSQIEESSHRKDLKHLSLFSEEKEAQIHEWIQSARKGKVYSFGKYDMHTEIIEQCDRRIEHHLVSPFIIPRKVIKDVDLNHYPADYFYLVEDHEVKYTLGDISRGTVLGDFVIGVDKV